jgi:hypothetical protein
MVILKINAKGKEKALRDAYNFVINHFSNERYNLVMQFPKQIYASDEQLMKKKQFAQCTLQNRILIRLLIKSGKFEEEDIEKKWRPFWGIHQFLIIKAGRNKFLVDPFLRNLEKLK